VSRQQYLPTGLLSFVAKQTGVPAKTVSDYISGIKRPGGKRAILLSDAFAELGIQISIRDWLESNHVKESILAAYEINGKDIQDRITQKTN